MALEYTLKPEEFGWLSQLFIETNPISPLTLFAEHIVSFDEDNKASLITQQIIDDLGNLHAEPYTVIQSLANANAYTRIRILGVDAPVDKIIYFDGKNRCSVDARKDDFLVKYPPLDEETGFAFSEYTGTSRFVNVTYKVKLPHDVARTFLLAMDVIRQRNLLLLARKETSLYFTVNDLVTEQNAQHSLFHLSKVLDSMIGQTKLNDLDFEKSLSFLEEQSMVKKNGQEWLFTQNTMALTMQMLVPQYHFNITHGDVKSNVSVEKSECYVSLFGIHDLLYIDQDGSDIVIETMSGSDLYLILMNAVS